jgi:hypothetical protein
MNICPGTDKLSLQEQVDQLQSKLIRAQTALDSSEELHKQLEVLTQVSFGLAHYLNIMSNW